MTREAFVYREVGSVSEMAMTAKAAALTSTGRVRSSNEDAFGLKPEHGVYIVCDGMGGAAGGEIASRIAVDTVLGQMAEADGTATAAERMHEAIAEANRAVLARAESDTGLAGMGTTLVALLLGAHPGQTPALIAHAGDSRCYLFRQGKLSRRTHDHSLVDEQVRLGTMTEEDAERSPFRSVITRAIGTQHSVTEDQQEMEVEKGDLFLLCTDGLTREVREGRIAEILREGEDLEATARKLIEEANEAGGHDNVTCVLVRLQPSVAGSH
jgi:PPM family protein phosphatase